MTFVEIAQAFGAVVIVTAAFLIVWATKRASFSMTLDADPPDDVVHELDEAIDRGLVVLIAVARVLPPIGMATSIVLLGHGLHPTGLAALAPSIVLRESVSLVAAAFLGALILSTIARTAHAQIRRMRDAERAERHRRKSSAKLAG